MTEGAPPVLPGSPQPPAPPPAQLPSGYLQGAAEWGNFGIGDIEEWSKLPDKYITTYLPELDATLGGGLPARAFSTIQGLPGSGKTSLALRSAARTAAAGCPVVFCSYELSRMDSLARLAAMRTGESWEECRSGLRLAAVRTTVDQLAELPTLYFIHDANQPLALLKQAIDVVAQRHGRPPVLYIDYLQALLNYTGDARLEAERLLRLLQADTNNGLTVVALSSVARGKLESRKDGPPSPADCLTAAKESGRVEYDSSVHMTVFLQPSPPTEDGYRFGWIIISKSRFGRAPATVPVRFHGPSGNFDVRPATNVNTQQQRDADLQQTILQAVRSGSFSTVDALAAALQRRVVDVRRAVQALESAGRLRRPRKGKPYQVMG